MQLLTNDKLKSVNHRVIAKQEGPRISVACFFRTKFFEPGDDLRFYGPIKELLSEKNPPVYKETTAQDYLKHYYSKGSGASALLHFKL